MKYHFQKARSNGQHKRDGQGRKRKMGNILDYLAWRGDLSFTQSPFNEVDNLILAELTYMNFEGMVFHSWKHPMLLEEAARRYFEKNPYTKDALGLFIPDEIQDLLREAAASRRFAGVRLSGFVNEIDEEEEKQFAALTFDIGDVLRYVSFRGTDDTLVGWKEDCNMSYQFPVPSHVAAQSYLERAAAAKPGVPLITGGHSKGGNLAMYAAAHCSQQVFERVQLVYNNDGPGFPTPEIASGIYHKLDTKLMNIIPEASIVGLLMEFRGHFRIVKSDAMGPAQHNALTWEVRGPAFHVFIREPRAVQRNKRTLHAWLREMDLQRRKEMVENLFAWQKNVEAKTLSDLFKNPTQTIPALFSSYDRETLEVLGTSFRLLMKEEKTSFKEVFRDEHKNFKKNLIENIQDVFESLKNGKKDG